MSESHFVVAGMGFSSLSDAIIWRERSGAMSVEAAIEEIDTTEDTCRTIYSKSWPSVSAWVHSLPDDGLGNALAYMSERFGGSWPRVIPSTVYARGLRAIVYTVAYLCDTLDKDSEPPF